MVEGVESLRGLCLEKRLLTLPSQQVSAGSRVEALAHREIGPVCLVELARWDGVDRA